ncbi:MAG: DNA cytosine methyltransferase [Rickettsia endosymbiont of Gnoriste bilineata]|nr:DNA cytosine methyltransferase [Rickettsia endosymbiont of Gnoriste bilineata]
MREYARIQSFPDSWNFVGSRSSQYRQIGNAAPVNLAYHIGRCLVAMLENYFDPLSMIILPEIMGYDGKAPFFRYTPNQ